MSPEGVNRLKTIRNTYKIIENVTPGSGSDIVTIPRIINALPLMASKINHQFSLARDFNGPFDSHLLPPSMKHTGFASLIPKEGAIGRFLQNAYVSHSLDLHCVVNNLTAKTLTVPDFNQQLVYFSNSHQSGMYGSSDRLKIVKSLGLGSSDVYDNLVQIYEVLKFNECLVWDEEVPSKNDYLSYFQEHPSQGSSSVRQTTATTRRQISQ